MQRLEPFALDMRVYLRGRHILVTQQHLHHTQIGSMRQQVRCKRMSQPMR